jgi:AcrR family transcriptional regulator
MAMVRTPDPPVAASAPAGVAETPAGADPEGDGERPLTARGARTRAKLVVAARAVFERDGFNNARIADIAVEAEVAYGTFYTYFPSKEMLFREVVRDLQPALIEPAATGPESISERIARAHRAYLDGYGRNARIMGVLEEVATYDEGLREMRRDIRQLFVDRTVRAIIRWQESGLADPTLDARYAGSALGSMVDRFAYVWLVLGEDFELDRAVDTLTQLWVNALRIRG